MKTPFRRKLIHLAVGYAIAGASFTALPPAMAVNTAPADPAAELAKPRDIQREWIELKNAVIEHPDDASLRERLGRLYLDRGDGAAAEKELSRAIQLGRDDYPVRLLLGQAWLLQGDYQRVFTDYDLSQASSDQDKAALAVLQGNARLASGRLDDARDAFESASALVPSYGPALIGLVEVALEQGDLGAVELELARIGADSAAVGSVDPIELLRLQGNLAFKRERFDQAEQAYRQALAQRPNLPVLLRGLAAAQMRQDKLDDARLSLDRLLSMQPNDGAAISLASVVAYRQKDFARAVQLAGALIGPGSDAAQPLFIAGASSVFTGAMQQAREYLTRYVALKPNDVVARRLLAQALMQTGSGAEAYAALKPLSDRASEDAQLLAELGMAAALGGAADEAVRYLEQAVQLEPDDLALRTGLAAARTATVDRAKGVAELERLATDNAGMAITAVWAARNRLEHGELEAALSAAQGLQAVVPTAPEPVLIQAVALLRQGELDQAEAAFKKALEMRPDDPVAQTGLAEIMLRRGQVESALSAFAALVDDNPRDVSTRINLAAAEMQAGRKLQAEQRLQRIVADNPDSTAARVALANVYIADSLPDRAIDILSEAQDAEEPGVVLASARADLVADRPEDAVEALERLVAAEPSSIDARLNLARAYERNAQPEAARGAYEETLKIAPDQRDARYGMLRQTLTQSRLPDAELDQAVDDAIRFIEQQPEDARSMVLRGLLLYRTDGQRDAGLAILAQVYQALPSADTAALLANLYVVDNRAAAAVELLDRRVSANPNDNYTRLRLARAQLAAGEYQQAAENLVRGIEQGARRKGLALVTAWALAQASRPTDARPYLKQAEAEGASGPMLPYTRGLMQLETGDASSAIASLQQAVNESAGAPAVGLRVDLARALAADGRLAQARGLVDTLSAEDLSAADRAQVVELSAKLR